MGFFKNATVYRVNASQRLSAALIEEALQRIPFRPVGSLEYKSHGFVHPTEMRITDVLTLPVNTCVFFALRQDEKKIPPAALTELVEARVKKIENEQMRKIGRKERKIIKEELVDQLLPNVLPTQRITRAYVDLAHDYLVIDTTSPARADDIKTDLASNLFLGGVTGQFLPPSIDSRRVSNTMSDWLLNGWTPDGWTIEDEGEIYDPQKQSIIRISGQDMESSDITNLLSTGRAVSKLGMTWQDNISMVLSASGLTFSKLDWLPLAQEKLQRGIDDETYATATEASLTIMTGDMRELIYATGELFGGLDALLESHKEHEYAD